MLIRNKKINAGRASEADTIKKLYQPRLSAKMPPLDDKTLLARVAKEASNAY